jgi:hypothetical protein
MDLVKPTLIGGIMRRISYQPLKRSLLAVALLGLLVGCGGVDSAQIDTAVMPANVLGTNGDVDVRSLDVAATVFGGPIRNNPAEAADAIAALDYMGGRLSTAPRWVSVDPLVQDELLQARVIMRRYAGISQSAPSQSVVDTMLALGAAYRADDRAEEQTLLRHPIFTSPPEVTSTRLANVPLIAPVNVATNHADQFPSFSTPNP